MMKLLLAGLFPGFLGGFSGPVVGQAAVQRRGAQPAIGGPELFRETTRVSVDSAGAQGNFTSLDPSISADGRYVVFRSLATNLVPLDTNGKTNVFLHDRASGTTTRVSVDSAGEQGNGGSFDASISGDGSAARSAAAHRVL